MAQWILACKELNGKVYVARLPKTIPPVNPNDLPKPGIPSAWVYVGPGLRPTIQHYTGNPNSFLLSFEYLSHLVCRVIPDIDATWPPTTVDPVTFSPTSIQLPEEAIAIKRDSMTGVGGAAYFFNPIAITDSGLFYDPFTNTYSVTISAAGGWVPLVNPAVTPFYRIYRRPLIGGPWTMVMDWNTVLTHVDSYVGNPFQFEYTATWGSLFDPAAPNDSTKHNEGVIGDGTILSFDSTTSSLSYAVSHDEQVLFSAAARGSTNAYMHGEPNQLFFVEAPTDEISLQKARLEDSTTAFCSPTSDFIVYQVVTGDDQGQIPVGLAYPQANAAPAGMYT